MTKGFLMTRVAVIDDWQEVARSYGDWSRLERRAEVIFHSHPFASDDAVAKALADVDIVLSMRERTPFSAALIARLPKLAMFSLTGKRVGTIDLAALRAKGVTLCFTGGGESGASTAELALGLLLAAARQIPAGDAAVRDGRFMRGVAPGIELAGKTLGLVGLGRIGAQMARYGRALGMDVIAWSENLTLDRAATVGAEAVEKPELFSRADAISVHLVLSDRTAKVVGAAELGAMKQGAILVNTSRAGLVDEQALVAAVTSGRIVAALDVFHQEPIPATHPLVTASNTVLTPHVGYGADEIYRVFYEEQIENALAFLDGAPIRVL
jgi:phosphoglycerate dehydrogenase-like enzyme